MLCARILKHETSKLYDSTSLLSDKEKVLPCLSAEVAEVSQEFQCIPRKVGQWVGTLLKDSPL